MITTYTNDWRVYVHFLAFTRILDLSESLFLKNENVANG